MKQTPVKTQKQLAEDIGVSTNSLCNYEKGMLPSLNNALKLADALNVPLDYLFGRGTDSTFDSKSSLGLLARSIIALAQQEAIDLPTDGSAALPVHNERLRQFLSDYATFSKGLDNDPNSPMHKMFDAWLNSQLAELDQLTP